jgi:hypothetical protein
VLSLPPSVRLFVATQPVDGRKGADSLMVIVRDVFGHDPLFMCRGSLCGGGGAGDGNHRWRCDHVL